VTEELWAHFKPKAADMLIKQTWPEEFDAGLEKERATLQTVIDVVTALRRIRSENNVEPGKEIAVTIVTASAESLESQVEHIKRLAKVGTLTFETKPMKPANSASEFLQGIELHVSLEGLFDPAKLKAGLEKERASLSGFVASLEAKLGNEKFVSNAPAAVIDEQREKLKEAKEKLEKVEERLKGL
jgi:valyl-tRNA synthetase